MEEFNKFNLKVLNEYSSFEKIEGNEIEVLNYLKNFFYIVTVQNSKIFRKNKVNKSKNYQLLDGQ